MIHLYSTIDEMHEDVSSCYDIKKKVILHPTHLSDIIIDRLAYSSQFSEPHTRTEAQNLIKEIGLAHGTYSASIQKLYEAIGNEEIKGFTVPAINVRMFTYDIAQTIFLLMQQSAIGPLVFELAISEQEYTYQPPQEFVAAILAGAIKSGYTGPVFIQGDHYQFRSEAYLKDKSAEISRIEGAIARSIEAGMYNIDIDGSTLVKLDKKSLVDQQFENFSVTAHMTEYIRAHQPKGTTISIGGEIGHIGGKNSTVEDFEVFMEGYTHLIEQKRLKGISKVSVQTGTHHGGIVSKDGKLEEVAVDFDVLTQISRVARRTYHMGGAVQHGASTLPDDLFQSFPEHETLEIHLSTGFQNIVYDNLPSPIKDKMYEWVRTNMSSEKKPDMTDEQFIYTARKKAWGPFKEYLWKLEASDKQALLDNIHAKVAYLASKLNVRNTRHMLMKYYDEK
ncbi:class II fructose-bisphosphate aldolase [Candidatus Woesebacteria bacterium]|nr:class II fructose-bisphosphate aldolase [Candidatus Woesebacteria bacterium]